MLSCVRAQCRGKYIPRKEWAGKKSGPAKDRDNDNDKEQTDTTVVHVGTERCPNGAFPKQKVILAR